MTATTFKQDFMASIVVFLVALPLCMGIAIASGVPVAAGLITGIVGGLVVGWISGCPLQVSGPAAGLTVIILDLVNEYGLEALGIVVLLAGLMQGAAGLLRTGQWFRAVSPAVVRGMLAGIGVLIIGSQFHVMVDDKPKGNGIENLVSIPQAIAKSLAMPSVQSQESREFRRDLLLEVGELHRRQQDLEELVAEVYPHVHNPQVAYTEEHEREAAERLQALVPVQEAIQRDLTATAERIQRQQERFANERRAAEASAAAQAALEQTSAALAALTAAAPADTLTAQDASVAAFVGLQAELKNHHFAAQLGVMAIVAIVAWQFVPKSLRLIPGPLVAVCVATIVAAVFALPVLYVEIPDNLWEGVHLPSLTVLQEIGWPALIQCAILIAVVASAETLLCVTAVDQLHSGERANYDKELFSQGVGNTVCGLLGVLPMTGVIVRSSANIQAGGQTRASAILHGVWLLLFVAVFGFLLRQIPTACLAAILVYTGFKLVNIKDIRKLAAYGKSEVLIYLATVVMIVATDLLTGVLVGIGLAAVKLLYTFSHLDANLQVDEETGKCELCLEGAATFIRLPRLAAELEKVPAACELHVDFRRLHYIDHACLELMMTWAKQHENTGGQLVIDWDSLHGRFRPDAGSAMNGQRAVAPPTAVATADARQAS